eukprot:PhF_6_TR14583/c0_g1_i2/m.23088
MTKRSTLPTWIIYIFFGIVVPIIILVVTLTPSVVTISNVSILCIAIILHNNMFHIINPAPPDASPKDANMKRCISIGVIGVICVILFGIPDYKTPLPPEVPVFDTG